MPRVCYRVQSRALRVSASDPGFDHASEIPGSMISPIGAQHTAACASSESMHVHVV